MEYSRILKFGPLIGVYAFYNVFATSAPADPWTAMKTALTNFAADPIAKLKAKTSNITTLAIVGIGVPILQKAFKIKSSGALGIIIKLGYYYVLGDQLAALINGPGRFGAVSGYTQASTWGGDQSAYHQPRPIMGMTSSSNYTTRR